MKKIIFILLALIVAGIVTYSIFFKVPKPVIDQETQLEQRDLHIEFRETGEVQPRNRLEIKPQFSGRIEEILVEEGAHIKKGQLLIRMSSSERAAMIDAARAISQKEYKRWSNIYKPSPIVAPMEGFIILRSKEPGQTVTAAEPILVMADDLIVEASIDETDLRYIKIGQKLSMYLDAYPTENFEGEVEHIAYEASVISNVTVYNIRIRPVKKPKVFRSGMTATITVVVESKKDAWSIPVYFISPNKEGKSSVRVKTDKGVVMREIKMGASDGRFVEVLEGLEQEEIIVTYKINDKKKARSKSVMTR